MPSNIALSHSRSITPISDPIHDRFEINIFERHLIDSNYFQRLHFVLQNSTTYVSFPANKNTRFPHSIGVAHIAGKMLTGALSNAERKVLGSFLNDAAIFIEDLVDILFLEKKPLDLHSNKKSKTIDEILDELYQDYLDTISGQSGFVHSPIHNVGPKLGYELKSISRIDTEEKCFGRQNKLNATFIVDALYQSVRFYGLVHDLGHLPMSHAFEHGLSNSVGIIIQLAGETKAELFNEILKSKKMEFSGIKEFPGQKAYVDLFSKILHCSSEDINSQFFSNGNKKNTKEKAFHEIRGISLYNRYISSFLEDFKVNGKLGKLGYFLHILTLSIIFSGAIKNTDKRTKKVRFLKSVRALVDGQADADRMDYTVRDGHESGSHIGTFDRTKIVNNSILLQNSQKEFTFGFYVRAVPGLEQFFEQRYQTYKYIIYHRTSARVNHCLEQAIARLFACAFIDPTSALGQTLHDSGYISVKECLNNSIKFEVLPDDINQVFMLDDASLRTLLFKVKQQTSEIIKHFDDKKSDQTGEIESKYFNKVRELDILLNIVLLRDFSSIETLFKRVYFREYFSKEIDNSANILDIIDFREFLVLNYKEILSRMQDKMDELFLREKRVCVLFHELPPKLFSDDQNRKSDFDQQIAIQPEGSIGSAHIGEHSPMLREMAGRAEHEISQRIYLLSNNLKFDKIHRKNVNCAIREFFKSEWNSWKIEAMNGGSNV